MSLNDILEEVSDHNRNLLKLYRHGSLGRKALMASLKFIKDAHKPGNWKVIQLREEGAKQLLKQDPLCCCLPIDLVIRRVHDQLSGIIFPLKEA